ncbi:MAG TPA: ribosome recycling factor [Firmicutes bacterium]|jgi:ribosome recycling factor|nr:ribosome recycling factor [Bacillota bacterium]
MVTEICREAEEKMQKTVATLQRDLASIRAGRATPSLLDKVIVDYYGTPTPLNQLASISAPEPRLLLVQPWDKNAVSDCERAILKSDLGLNPATDGSVIRLVIPQLTEERRIELTKVVRKKAEEAKVAVRNLRRDANERLKKLEKDGEISKDEQHRIQGKIQKLTDTYIEKLDQVLAAKEEEIMEV